MALKLSSVFTCLSVTSLAVPFPGAMALKRRSNTQQSSTLATCSPLPRGDGAETILHDRQSPSKAHAVPFPGAMALKRRYGVLHGAGGYLAVPFPGAMALKPYLWCT